MKTAIAKKLFAFAAVLGFAMIAPLVYSQDTGTDEQTASSNEVETSGANAETEEQEQSSETTPELTQVEDEEEQSSARFIPSEQLSQDLGASFPVDI